MTASIDSRRRRGCRHWRKLALFAWAAGCIGALFLLYVGHPYYLSRGWSHPKRLAVCCVTPADYGLDYQEVSFTTSDGLTLRGWYVPSTNGAAVILVHPIASNRVAVLKVAEVLARNGYGVLLFDLWAHGESDGELHPFGGSEAEDIRGLAAYLQTRTDVDPDRFGAMGLPVGAHVSILGAARTEAIRAVVADAPCCTTFGDMPPPASPSDWLWVPYDLVFFPMLQLHTGVSDPEPVREGHCQGLPSTDPVDWRRVRVEHAGASFSGGTWTEIVMAHTGGWPHQRLEQEAGGVRRENRRLFRPGAVGRNPVTASDHSRKGG